MAALHLLLSIIALGLYFQLTEFNQKQSGFPETPNYQLKHLKLFDASCKNHKLTENAKSNGSKSLVINRYKLQRKHFLKSNSSNFDDILVVIQFNHQPSIEILEICLSYWKSVFKHLIISIPRNHNNRAELRKLEKIDKMATPFIKFNMFEQISAKTHKFTAGSFSPVQNFAKILRSLTENNEYRFKGVLQMHDDMVFNSSKLFMDKNWKEKVISTPDVYDRRFTHNLENEKGEKRRMIINPEKVNSGLKLKNRAPVLLGNMDEVLKGNLMDSGWLLWNIVQPKDGTCQTLTPDFVLNKTCCGTKPACARRESIMEMCHKLLTDKNQPENLYKINSKVQFFEHDQSDFFYLPISTSKFSLPIIEWLARATVHLEIAFPNLAGHLFHLLGKKRVKYLSLCTLWIGPLRRNATKSIEQCEKDMAEYNDSIDVLHPVKAGLHKQDWVSNFEKFFRIPNSLGPNLTAKTQETFFQKNNKWPTRVGPKYPFKSTLTQKIHQHQSNCKNAPKIYDLNIAGFGADIHHFSDSVGLSMLSTTRLLTNFQNSKHIPVIPTWRWLSKEDCDEKSGLNCYFNIPVDNCKYSENYMMENTDYRNFRKGRKNTNFDGIFNELKLHTSKVCQNLPKYCGSSDEAINKCEKDCESSDEAVINYMICRKTPYNCKGKWHRSLVEYLFSSGLTDVVLKEVKSQIAQVFGRGGIPKNMITVHIRWGNKYIEAERLSIEAYTEAIMEHVKSEKHLWKQNKNIVNIYLATEDPIAKGYLEKSLKKLNSGYNFRIFLDATVDINLKNGLRPDVGFNETLKWGRNIDRNIATATNGKYGLQVLASVIIACNANSYILTTSSNLSRLMDEIRQNVVDANFNNITRLIDLQRNWGQR